MTSLIPDVDGGGVVGAFLSYGMAIATMGATVLVFIHLWRKGRLDMDEQPKYHMMREDEELG